MAIYVNSIGNQPMSDLSTFATTTKSLARNPLGIIALFIVLIYGFAALALGMTSSLQTIERLPLVWFLVVFPVIVLAVFAWLVSQHHEKLYAPDDFKTDQGFLEGVKQKLASAREIEARQERLKLKVSEVITASQTGKIAIGNDVAALVKQVQEEIDSATNVKIDARTFLNDTNAIFELPVAVFETLGELTDAVYFKLSPSVKPYAYGHSWVMRDKSTGSIIKTARMITGAGSGQPVPDKRPLREVGITAGSYLVIERPHEG
jgi:hypothetical protein